MNQNRLIAIGALIAIVLMIVSASFYTVDERQKTVVTRFGEMIRYDDKAGLHYKTPFVDQVIYFESRILTMDAAPTPFLTQEKKYVMVDSFVKWRIRDARKFYLTVGGQYADARLRLDQMVNSSLRDEVNKLKVKDVVSKDRAKIMETVTRNTREEALKFGIDIVDVRIQRVDLPPEVSKSVYDRMKAERSRIANELRAQGDEESKKIRAEANKTVTVTLANAYRKSEGLRGDGDARATAIYGTAANAAPEFYSLYRSLKAYQETFKNKDDILIVDPSSDFFRYMKKP
ncbi:MAG TPA: protease modulator HflC [Anaerolineae bacterium]|nr:protease modulator HflC [Anaerolineae bacterium]